MACVLPMQKKSVALALAHVAKKKISGKICAERQIPLRGTRNRGNWNFMQIVHWVKVQRRAPVCVGIIHSIDHEARHHHYDHMCVAVYVCVAQRACIA